MPQNWRSGQAKLPDGESECMVLIHSLIALCEEMNGCETCRLPCQLLYDRFCGKISQGNGGIKTLTPHDVLRFLVDFSEMIGPTVENHQNLGHQKAKGDIFPVPVHFRPCVAQRTKVKV